MTKRTVPQAATRFLDLVRQGKVVFFIGSGVSLSHPACLPSAKRLLSLGLSLYLPDDAVDQRTVVSEKMWPEVYYQELMAFIGEGALLPFHALAHPAASPTFAHYLIVCASARGGVPIITTNFDCLLEEAARSLLGIEPRVIGPAGPYSGIGHSFSIWKVHGSVGSDILATMPRITQPNVNLLRELHLLLMDRHICFVGYSGSDIDLFPMIKEFVGIKKPIWIDPFRTAPLLLRAKSIRATFIQCTLDEAFSVGTSDVLNELRNAGISPDSIRRRATEESSLRSMIDDELSRIENEARSSCSLSMDQKRLLLAICLARVGAPMRALEYLRSHPTLGARLGREDQVLLLVTMARLSDCVSDYRASEDFAKAGLTEINRPGAFALDDKAVALRVQGLHALSMAKKMQLGPSFSYGGTDVDFMPNPVAVAVVLTRYIWAASRMKLLLGSLDSRPSNSRADVWQFFAWHWYLDHMLVLFSLLEAGFGRAPGLRALWHWWIQRSLRRLEAKALQNGDARVLAHVQKELQRHGFESTAKLALAFTAYDLVTDPLNRALVHRNAGDSLLNRERRTDAKREFEKSLLRAIECGSRATVLKALVGLHVCGETITASDLDSHVRGISGLGYERFITQFRRALH